MRAFCVSKMNVLFTKFLQEQATEDTGNLLRSLSMFFDFKLTGSLTWNYRFSEWAI